MNFKFLFYYMNLKSTYSIQVKVSCGSFYAFKHYFAMQKM